MQAKLFKLQLAYYDFLHWLKYRHLPWVHYPKDPTAVWNTIKMFQLENKFYFEKGKFKPKKKG